MVYVGEGVEFLLYIYEQLLCTRQGLALVSNGRSAHYEPTWQWVITWYRRVRSPKKRRQRQFWGYNCALLHYLYESERNKYNRSYRNCCRYIHIKTTEPSSVTDWEERDKRKTICIKMLLNSIERQEQRSVSITVCNTPSLKRQSGKTVDLFKVLS